MERRNHILLDMVRFMMCFMDLSISFWRFALEIAVYVLNKVPSKSISTTPYKIRKVKRPSLKHLKIWGCPAYVKNIDGHKFSARSEKYRFVDYLNESIGYYFYHPTQQKVFVGRHAIFLEKEFIQERGNGKSIEHEEV